MCSYGWDLQDAHVVCRQLGYNGAKTSVDSQAMSQYYSGGEKIWLDNVQCVGNEASIMGCKNNGWNVCLHSKSASLICSPEGTLLRLIYISCNCLARFPDGIRLLRHVEACFEA